MSGVLSTLADICLGYPNAPNVLRLACSFFGNVLQFGDISSLCALFFLAGHCDRVFDSLLYSHKVD